MPRKPINDLTYTVKLKRREILALCVFITQYESNLNKYGFATMEEIKIKLRKQYRSEDEKRMEGWRQCSGGGI